ncbi:hypothetical protein BH10PAT1_BH10PAT1_3590 [soil metagenome]
MPKDETEKKKFKAVTEEVNDNTPEIKEPEPEKEMEEVKLDEEKPSFGVTETNNISNDEGKKEKGAFLKIFLITFFATLLAFLLAGGIYVYLTGVKSVPGMKSTPTPIATNEPDATPTPAPDVDVSTYKISVLNGNGGIGVASALKTIIEKDGFKVTDTANADNFNFTDTLIEAKSTVSPDAVAKLKTSLDSNYSVKIGDPLDATSAYDIVITVGSK